jgi:hypothetical protein
VEQLEQLVQYCVSNPNDYEGRRALTDFLEEHGELPATSERFTFRWPHEERGRWYWWHENMSLTIAALSAKLPARIYDRLPPGIHKRATDAEYATVLEAFRALYAALQDSSPE